MLRPQSGHTPLQIAIMCDNTESVHQLLVLGAEVNPAEGVRSIDASSV